MLEGNVIVDTTIKLSISLPAELVEQVDRLVKHSYSARSVVIREALIKFMREPDKIHIANRDLKLMTRLYEYVKEDYPFVSPDDHELIQTMYETKRDKERGQELL